MKSSKVLYKIAYFLIVILVAVFTVGYAFAWFFDRKDDAEFSITGASAGAYFESGNGSEESPFIISNPTHMHNLAVLQNMGKLDQKYYFQIKKTIDEIDMSGRYIPPIGNDEHPFIGDFDGNGKTLKNLKVTTNKTLLKDEYPAHATTGENGYKFSQAVGLFGMTGATSDIHNVILENPSVDVAATDTLYSSTARAYAGLAVGMVNGKASSIGVRANTEKNTALKVEKTGYTTFNSILGALGQDVTSSVTGGGHGSGGSGANFGANFDMASVLNRLYKIFKGKYGYEYVKDSNNDPVPLPNSSPELPQISTANNLPTPAAGAKIAFTADESKSTYEGPDAKEAISNQNVGYFLGNENKFATKRFTFGDRLIPPFSANWQGKVFVKGSWEQTTDLYLESDTGKTYILDGDNNKIYVTPDVDADGDYVYNGTKLGIDTGKDWFTVDSSGNKKNPDASGNIPSWFYTYDSYVSDNAGTVYTSESGFRELRQSEYDELPTNLKNLLAKAGEQKSFTTIRISQGGLIAQNHGNTEKTQWSYHGQISWMGKTYGKGFKGADGTAVDENGNLMPVTAVYDEDGNYVSGDYYTGNGNQTKEFNFYTGGVALPNNAIWFKPAQAGKFRFVMYSESNGDGFILNKIVRKSATPSEPFKVDPSKADNNLEMSTVIQQRLPSEVLFYYEYNVTDAEIAAGNVEFLLQKNGSGGAHFVYLDIGASATDDVSTIDREKAVSAIDFIYDGVEINQKNGITDSDGNAIAMGNFIVSASGTTAELYEASQTSIYFNEYKTVLQIVYVRLHGRSDEKTINLSNYTSTTIKDSGVYATAPGHVLPEGITNSGSGGGGTVVDPDPGTDPETPTVSGVTVTPATTTVESGKTTTLTASVTMSDGSSYDGDIVWTSSDESIATVENGVVTAKSVGSVTITASAGGISASATITVEAATVAKYTVSFSLNYTGATGAPASQQVEENSTATAPVAPTREGYTFGGWYTTSACTGTVYDFTTPITEDTTLYAKWTASGVAGQTFKEVYDGTTKINEGSAFLTVKDGEEVIASCTSAITSGNVNNAGTYTDETGTEVTNGKRVQLTANFTVSLKVGYKYTIYIYSGSSGGTARTYTIKNGETEVGTGLSGTSSAYGETKFENIIPDGNDGETVNYTLTSSGNVNLARFVIVATKL